MNKSYLVLLIIFLYSVSWPSYSQSNYCNKKKFDPELILKWSIGNDDALVEVTILTSLDCYHCAGIHRDVLPLLRKNYVDTGKIKYTSIHVPGSLKSLMLEKIAHCYAWNGTDQQSQAERYFSLMNLLYKIQGSFVNQTNIQGYVKQIGMINKINNPRFDKCVNDDDIQDQLVNSYHMVLCREDGYYGTPEIIINGKKLLGYKDYDVLAKEIDNALQKAKKEKL
ncbi:MAG: hypothetical protein P857_1011 [Candidatus Xenolissoclinum pacificiensis L6]|uniref:Thioredoxin-like fold domain-containing protein n=1 Tax=Candidatus Xenolissoclinum pacificiensis L6 TaxID=1401685 RepID=W2V305_9RICK|nr:MAG: hypothetical protein P857_1011 [Candidatus Xenolissoclinum pacificiensis L6]